ncbi:MAG: hypothetical protein AAGH68_07600 [Pseudomonadota bacterium]
MQRYISAIAVAALLQACAAPEQPVPQKPSVRIENRALSVAGPSREASDQACRSEADGFDTALSRRSAADTIMDAFDAVALCRRTEALRLAAQLTNKAQAGAALIGLRGAMRRDVDRLRRAMAGRRDANALGARIARAQSLQTIQIVNDS